MELPLQTVDARPETLAQLTGPARYTVVVFVALHCPCFAAHDQRLRDLAQAYGPRGVAFVGVDSEVDETPATVAAKGAERGLPFPILLDPGARLADRLGAEYATYTVILDRDGRVLYRGGIDADKQRLHDDTTMYVRDALEDLVNGRPPRLSEGKALGCVLRRW
jgi:peroxiredoxin